MMPTITDIRTLEKFIWIGSFLSCKNRDMKTLLEMIRRLLLVIIYGFWGFVFLDLFRDMGSLEAFIERVRYDEEFYMAIGFIAIAHLVINFVFLKNDKQRQNDE